VDQILNVLIHWPPVLIYLVTALVVGAETGTIIGLALPGEITLLVVGFLCFDGTLHLAVALPVMIVAGLLGDSLGYLEGRRVGPRLRHTRLGQRVGDERWAKADRLLLAHRGRAVFLARLIAFARTLTPRLAGMSGLPYRVFLPWNAAGVVLLVGGTVMVGYAAGRSYASVADVFGQATGALFALVLVIVAIVLLGRYLGRYPDPIAAAAKTLTSWRPLRFLGRAYRFAFGWLTVRIGVGGAVAVNVLGGALVLLGAGYALTWTVDRVVRSSGLPLIDPLINDWVLDRRTAAATEAATVTLSVLRGSVLVVLVGLVAVLLNWRSRVWRADLVGVLGTVGAFIPLVVIALDAEWERSPTSSPAVGLFHNQTTVVTASVGMLAWLLARRFGWRWAVPAWTGAVLVVVLVVTARIYLGWSWPSESIGSILLGSLWVLVFVVAWHTRDRVNASRGDRSGQTRELVSR
jgi:undecaprenyl-diphosphatase